MSRSSFLVRRRAAGLSLIELMVAMALGLLVTLGIATLFGTTSTTNRVQNGLARLQENGRFLVSRIASDLRMTAAQYCSTSGDGPTSMTANGQQQPARAPMLHVANFTFPDWGGAAISTGAAVPLSPRYFAQGYECSSAACAPAQPAIPTDIPAAGTGVGNRVRGSDILTVRYLRGAGWPVTSCTVRPIESTVPPDITVTPDPKDPPLDVAPGELVVVSDCSRSSIFKAAVAGNVITPADLPAGPPVRCPAGSSEEDPRIAGGEPRLFNFSKDFVTVTYYLRVRADANPDRTDRLVPVLMRRESDRSGRMQEQELAEGIERLDFLYGVEDAQGRVAYLRADEVNTITSCPPAPEGVGLAAEGACGWRSIKSIEVHMLLSTVENLDISTVDTAYRYSIDGPDIAPPPATFDSGLPAGRMMRREFVALVTTRNSAQ